MCLLKMKMDNGLGHAKLPLIVWNAVCNEYIYNYLYPE
jgi:hypothetical protein